MDWQNALGTLQKQFESQATRSRGLHHLMVEVADDERDRMSGPDWFVHETNRGMADPAAFQRADRWHMVHRGGLPWIHPGFRAVNAEEDVEKLPRDSVICDGSGRPQAVQVPMRLRSSYLCGDSHALKGFESLANAASCVLTDAKGLAGTEYAVELLDLFRQPRGGIRYIFGNVDNPPSQFVARGWDAGVLMYKEGILIDQPIAESTPGLGHWLLLLHRLAWRNVPGCPLRAQKLAWHENTTVPYEWLVQREFDAQLPQQWREGFARITTTSYYSVLGEQDHPLDVNLASAFAIGLLLSAKTTGSSSAVASKNEVAYSNESWNKRPVPPIAQCEIGAAEIRRRIKPKVVLLTATPIERDMVLKHLEPVADQSGLIRVYQEKNAYFIGRLGQYPVVVCMSGTGASGRDTAQIVTGEVI